MPKNIQDRADHFYKTWQENNRYISAADDYSYMLIDNEIDQIKSEILDVISALR